MPKPYPLLFVIRVLERKGFFLFHKMAAMQYRERGSPTLTVVCQSMARKFRMAHFVPFAAIGLKESDFRNKNTR